MRLLLFFIIFGFTNQSPQGSRDEITKSINDDLKQVAASKCKAIRFNIKDLIEADKKMLSKLDSTQNELIKVEESYNAAMERANSDRPDYWRTTSLKMIPLPVYIKREVKIAEANGIKTRAHISFVKDIVRWGELRDYSSKMLQESVADFELAFVQTVKAGIDAKTLPEIVSKKLRFVQWYDPDFERNLVSYIHCGFQCKIGDYFHQLPKESESFTKVYQIIHSLGPLALDEIYAKDVHPLRMLVKKTIDELNSEVNLLEKFL